MYLESLRSTYSIMIKYIPDLSANKTYSYVSAADFSALMSSLSIPYLTYVLGLA